MQIHGGGWVIGDKREQGIPLLDHLAAQGWVGFNVNYRLSPSVAFPEHLIDLKRASPGSRSTPTSTAIDPDFLCVTGGSAGGHLTALVALTANDPRYQPGFEDVDTSVAAAVPFYGIYDFTTAARSGHKVVQRFIEPIVMKAFLADDPEAFADASPIHHLRADAPPFFVIHGNKDTLAPVEDARTLRRAAPGRVAASRCSTPRCRAPSTPSRSSPPPAPPGSSRASSASSPRSGRAARRRRRPSRPSWRTRSPTDVGGEEGGGGGGAAPRQLAQVGGGGGSSPSTPD